MGVVWISHPSHNYCLSRPPPLSFPFSLSLYSPLKYVCTVQYSTSSTQRTQRTPNARTLRPARHTYVMYLTLHCTQSTADLFFSSALLKNCHLFFFLSFCLSVFLFLFPLGRGGNAQEIPIPFYNTFSNQKINFYYFYLIFFFGHTQKKKFPVFELYIFIYVCMYCTTSVTKKAQPYLSLCLSLSLSRVLHLCCLHSTL